jgi:hypothetical protein
MAAWTPGRKAFVLALTIGTAIAIVNLSLPLSIAVALGVGIIGGAILRFAWPD